MKNQYYSALTVLEIIFLLLAFWGFLVMIFPREFQHAEPELSLEIMDVLKGVGQFIGCLLFSIYIRLIRQTIKVNKD